MKFQIGDHYLIKQYGTGLKGKERYLYLGETVASLEEIEVRDSGEYFRFLPVDSPLGFQGYVIHKDLIKYKDDGQGDTFIVLKKITITEQDKHEEDDDEHVINFN